jgi:hypothetical protein
MKEVGKVIADYLEGLTRNISMGEEIDFTVNFICDLWASGCIFFN